ncbi:MAG: hypothetical protein K1X35_14435 [Caulobacteraceae bacterium]|nr:hypothetical protein [Caulobacteraceae bacterium]
MNVWAKSFRTEFDAAKWLHENVTRHYTREIVNVRLTDLPVGALGTVEWEGDAYLIKLAMGQGIERMVESWFHEIAHIVHGDVPKKARSTEWRPVEELSPGIRALFESIAADARSGTEARAEAWAIQEKARWEQKLNSGGIRQ